jgi:hypothetical protein
MAAFVSSLAAIALATLWLTDPPFAPDSGALVGLVGSLVVYVGISLGSRAEAATRPRRTTWTANLFARPRGRCMLAAHGSIRFCRFWRDPMAISVTVRPKIPVQGR